MTRTLVIAPQWIGDAVMAEPLLATLAERGDVVTVAALPWVAPVFQAMPEVQETIELPFAHGRLDWRARRRVAASLRGRFDVAYVLPNSFKAALVPWFARIPRRIGYRGEGRSLLLTERRERGARRPPMVPFYGALAGTAFDERRRPRLQLAPERIDATAAAHGLRPSVVLGVRSRAPSTGRRSAGPPRTTPRSRARSTRATPLRSHCSVRPAKRRSATRSPPQAAGACRVLAGKTSLVDAIALIAGSRGLASNDSGLMHVAAAFGIPQVAVFGSTSPLHTPPLNDRARVLWLKDELQLDCMPCFDRTCRFDHYRCLTAVTPDRVLAALAPLKGRQRRPPLPLGGRGAKRGGSNPESSLRSTGSSRLQRELPGVDDRPGRLAGRRSAERLVADGERVDVGEHLAAQRDRRAAAGRQHAERARRRAVLRHRPELERAVGPRRDWHDRPRHERRAIAADAGDDRRRRRAARCRSGRRENDDDRRRRRARAREQDGKADRREARERGQAAPERERSQAPATTLFLRSSRSEIRRHTSPEGCTGSIAAVIGISRSCHAFVARRNSTCAGSSASKRRRAAPRIVPIT